MQRTSLLARVPPLPGQKNSILSTFLQLYLLFSNTSQIDQNSLKIQLSKFFVPQSAQKMTKIFFTNVKELWREQVNQNVDIIYEYFFFL